MHGAQAVGLEDSTHRPTLIARVPLARSLRPRILRLAPRSSPLAPKKFCGSPLDKPPQIVYNYTRSQEMTGRGLLLLEELSPALCFT